MADNRVSYKRFSNLPDDISEYGVSLQELKGLKGTPPKNPVAAPMALPRIAGKQLFLSPSGSDELRLGEPKDPEDDPFLGPLPTLTLARRTKKKLGSAVLKELLHHLQNADTQVPVDDTTRFAMQGSLSRVAKLQAYLVSYIQTTEPIYARTLSHDHA